MGRSRKFSRDGVLQNCNFAARAAGRPSCSLLRLAPAAGEKVAEEPFGTKRLEIEYHESIPVENFKSYFAIPLRPDAYQAQAAQHLRINFELRSAHAISKKTSGDFATNTK